MPPRCSRGFSASKRPGRLLPSVQSTLFRGLPLAGTRAVLLTARWERDLPQIVQRVIMSILNLSPS